MVIEGDLMVMAGEFVYLTYYYYLLLFLKKKLVFIEGKYIIYTLATH